uniref:Uncharacterized protein n=1 Tax=Aegilops tauschii subsp. strangulata TaxID=200361 RepID=A0A453A8N2_AEGTS
MGWVLAATGIQMGTTRTMTTVPETSRSGATDRAGNVELARSISLHVLVLLLRIEEEKTNQSW